MLFNASAGSLITTLQEHPTAPHRDVRHDRVKAGPRIIIIAKPADFEFSLATNEVVRMSGVLNEEEDGRRLG